MILTSALYAVAEGQKEKAEKNAEEARANAKEADQNAEKAGVAEREATKARLKAQEDKIRLTELQARNSQEEGDMSGALLWTARALKTCGDLPSEDYTKTKLQLRYQSILQQVQLVPNFFFQDGFRAAALSPDGRQVFTGGNSASLCDIKTCERKMVLGNDKFSVKSAAFCSPYLVLARGHQDESGTASGDAFVWNLTTEEREDRLTLQTLLRDYPGYQATIARHVAAGPSGAWNAGAGGVVLVFQQPKSNNRPDDYTRSLVVAWCLKTDRKVGIPLDYDARDIACSSDGASLCIIGRRRTSPDSKTNVTGEEDFIEFRGATGDDTFTCSLGLPMHGGSYPNCVSFSPDGELLVVAGGDDRSGWADVWKTKSLKHSAPTKKGPRDRGHKKRISWQAGITSACFSPDSEQLLTTCFDGTAMLWDVDAKDEKVPQTIFPHPTCVLCGSFSPDGKYVATGSRDRTARIWEVATGKMVAAPMYHHGSVEKVQFVACSKQMCIFTTSTEMALVWELKINDSDSFRPEAGTWVSKAVLSEDARRLMTVSQPRREARGDNAVEVWDCRTKNAAPSLLLRVPHQGEKLSDPEMSSNGERVATIHPTKVVVWNTDATAPNGHLHAEVATGGPVQSAVLSRDGKVLLTTEKTSDKHDGMLRVWDVANPGAGKLLNTLGRSGHEVTFMRLSPDLRWAAVAAKIERHQGEYTVRVWEIGNQSLSPQSPIAPQFEHKYHSDRVIYLAFSPGSRYLVSTGDVGDRRAVLTDLSTHKHTVWEGHTSGVTHASFSQGDKYIITISRDQTAIIHGLPPEDKPHEDKPKATLRHSDQIAEHATFSTRPPFTPGSPGVVTAGGDGTARIWDVDKGSSIAEFQHRYDEAISSSQRRNRIVQTVFHDVENLPKLTTLSYVELGSRESPDGRQVVVKTWSLSVDNMPATDTLMNSAQLRAARKFNKAETDLDPLDRKEIQELSEKSIGQQK